MTALRSLVRPPFIATAARLFSSSSALRQPSLVVAEVLDDGSVASGLGSALNAANQIDADVDVLVAGGKTSAAAEDVASGKYGKLKNVLRMESDELQHLLAEKITPVIVNTAKEGSYTHVVSASSTFGKNVLPRVAALLDVAAISDIMKVISASTFVRPIYAGNALATVESNDDIKILTVRTTNFAAEPADGLAAAIKELTNDTSATVQSEWISNEISKSERPELASAKVVVAGGRGLKEPSNFKMIEELADQLGGAVGATRAIVDAGWVPNDYQVGQTGKVVAPDLYIAVGISGAIQHLAGMKDSKVIVAINKDEEAPIFTVADYGVAGDLFKVVPELMSELKK